MTWLAAVQHLSTCPDWECYNLLLEVRDPMRREAVDKRIEERVDVFLRTAECHPLSTVAETIFPAAEYRRHGPQGVYTTYPDDVYPHIKPLSHWGTYAHRLVRREGPAGVINPLQVCVEKIVQQSRGPSMKAACYELSLRDLDLEIPLYDPALDRNRHLGGPCLSHISLKVTRDRQLLLTALYRSHYYLQRALGNLLGLARLQAFVCEQAELLPGPLVCVSTLARIERESGWTKANVRDLIAELQTLTTVAST